MARTKLTTGQNAAGQKRQGSVAQFGASGTPSPPPASQVESVPPVKRPRLAELSVNSPSSDVHVPKLTLRKPSIGNSDVPVLKLRSTLGHKAVCNGTELNNRLPHHQQLPPTSSTKIAGSVANPASEALPLLTRLKTIDGQYIWLKRVQHPLCTTVAKTTEPNNNPAAAAGSSPEFSRLETVEGKYIWVKPVLTGSSTKTAELATKQAPASNPVVTTHTISPLSVPVTTTKAKLIEKQGTELKPVAKTRKTKEPVDHMRYPVTPRISPVSSSAKFTKATEPVNVRYPVSKPVATTPKVSTVSSSATFTKTIKPVNNLRHRYPVSKQVTTKLENPPNSVATTTARRIIKKVASESKPVSAPAISPYTKIDADQLKKLLADALSALQPVATTTAQPFKKVAPASKPVATTPTVATTAAQLMNKPVPSVPAVTYRRILPRPPAVATTTAQSNKKRTAKSKPVAAMQNISSPSVATKQPNKELHIDTTPLGSIQTILPHTVTKTPMAELSNKPLRESNTVASVRKISGSVANTKAQQIDKRVRASKPACPIETMWPHSAVTSMAKRSYTQEAESVPVVTRVRTPEGKYIWLKKGNIAQSQVDAIVNTTCPKLILNRDMVSRSILASAGQQLQDECDLLVGRRYGINQLQVPSGEFRITGPGSLTRIKGIYHAVCPTPDTPNAEQILSTLVYNILVDAHNAGMGSIAFPGLGTGSLFPKCMAARLICEQMVKFSHDFTNSNLYDMRLVATYSDSELYKAFQFELGVIQNQLTSNSNKPKKSKETASIENKVPETSNQVEVVSISDNENSNTQGSSVIIIDSQDSSSGSNASNNSTSSSDELSGVWLSPPSVAAFSEVASVDASRISLPQAPRAPLPSPSRASTLPPVPSSTLLPVPSQSRAPPNRGKPIEFENITEHSWGTSAMWMEAVNIQLSKGDLTKETTHAIVVQTCEDFHLNGRMATAVVNKGGPTIDMQCRWLKKSLKGPLTVTSCKAGVLECTEIIFIALTDRALVKKRTIEALQLAEEKGFNSVAIPALGTGELCGMPQQCASEILDGIGEFIAANNPKTVDRIKIVIYEAYMLDDFKTVFRNKIGKSYGYRAKKAPKRAFPATSPRNGISAPKRTACSYEEEQYCKKDLPYDSELMGNLETANLNKIKQCAAKYKVTVTSLPYGQTRVKSFKLEGRRLDVLQAKSDIQELYLTYQKQYTEYKEAHKLSEGVKWQWWDAEQGRFIDYDVQVMAEIEKAYQECRPFVEPSKLGKYRIDVRSMKEIDLSNGLPAKETGVIRLDLGGGPKSVRSDLPENWYPMAKDENLKIVDLDRGSAEFISAQNAFLSSAGHARVTVVQIQRIQNKELHRQYQAKKDTMEIALQGVVNSVEQTVYHGTAVTTCDAINRRGFNRSYQGRNAYGEGTYFAKNASYSVSPNYSVPDHRGRQHMYMCKVLTGECTRGMPGMRVLPPKPGKPNEIYDSFVDHVQKPQIFVILHDAQAYPEYLVSFCSY